MSQPSLGLLTLCLLLVWLGCVKDACHAQLSFHTDANTNSFTLKTPGLQQSFTRYYGAAKQQQQQPQTELQQQVNPNQFGGLASQGVQYSAAYPQQASAASVKTKQPQQQQQQYLTQQQQQPQQQQNVPSYADQMQSAFADYQRQRLEFEQQQQQLLERLYTYYPDVSGQQQHQLQHQAEQPQPQPQPQLQQQQSNFNTAGSRFITRQSSSPFGGNNGLQPQQYQRHQYVHPTVNDGLADFYSTQHHVGFMQQQQQNVLRHQQENVAQQFATGQSAPSTTTNYGMAVPESSVAASYQPASDVSRVRFTSGNLNYNF